MFLKPEIVSFYQKKYDESREFVEFQEIFELVGGKGLFARKAITKMMSFLVGFDDCEYYYNIAKTKQIRALITQRGSQLKRVYK